MHGFVGPVEIHIVFAGRVADGVKGFDSLRLVANASRPYLLIIDQAGRGALKGALRRPGIFVGNFGSSLL
jgi:hypothetical protein